MYMAEQKPTKNWKHADDTKPVNFWVKKEKFDAWKKACEKHNITMTDLIIRGVDDKIADYELGKAKTSEQQSLQEHTAEIMARLDVIDAKIAEKVKDSPIVNDEHVQNQIKAILKRGGSTTEEDLVELLDIDRNSLIDILSVMKEKDGLKSDAYGVLSLS